MWAYWPRLKRAHLTPTSCVTEKFKNGVVHARFIPDSVPKRELACPPDVSLFIRAAREETPPRKLDLATVWQIQNCGTEGTPEGQVDFGPWWFLMCNGLEEFQVTFQRMANLWFVTFVPWEFWTGLSLIRVTFWDVDIKIRNAFRISLFCFFPFKCGKTLRKAGMEKKKNNTIWFLKG